MNRLKSCMIKNEPLTCFVTVNINRSYGLLVEPSFLPCTPPSTLPIRLQSNKLSLVYGGVISEASERPTGRTYTKSPTDTLSPPTSYQMPPCPMHGRPTRCLLQMHGLWFPVESQPSCPELSPYEYRHAHRPGLLPARSLS